MVRDYQVKWFFILTGVIIATGLLTRIDNLGNSAYWELLDYCTRTSLVFAICWFINAYFILHNFRRISNLTKTILGNLLSTFLVYFMIYITTAFFPHNNNLIEHKYFDWTTQEIIEHIVVSFIVNIICYLVFYSIHTNITLQTFRLKNEMLGQEHLRAQLVSLQQQVSPHFLFNSLNTLKNIASDKPTKNYIVQLANVYRYVLGFNERYLTRLKDELIFIKSYLYIMHQRFEDGLIIDLDIPENYYDTFIPPLSLQLLIENAIKHNRIDPENPLCVSIFTDNTPSLIIKNNYQPKMNSESTGTGIKNISQRYKILANKQILVVNDGYTFTVSLPLLSNASSYN